MIERETLESIHAVKQKRFHKAWCESMPRKGKYLVVDCDKNGTPIDAYYTEVLPDHLREPPQISERELAWREAIVVAIAIVSVIFIGYSPNIMQNTSRFFAPTTINR